MTEIQAIISGDLMRLGHPQSSINAAITWFQNSARKTPVREPKRHSYNLHDQAGDLIAESWANAMACAGVTQEFISNCLWLLGELNKRLGGKAPAQGRASNSTEAMLSQLSDKDYAAVVKINEQAQANTMQVLQRKWGEYTYLQNIAIAQRYLDSLPAIEQAHFDQFTSVNGVDWIDLRNTAEFVTAMFDAATGAHNIPTSGGAVQAEINQIESLMRTPVTRRAYMNDPQLQGRLRTLYDIRDKEK
ncbi:hypothetical protein BC89_30665 [Pseudomonas monteilii]|nr:hypothetical protein BC89_30665 [Pseudomonas monteilii]